MQQRKSVKGVVLFGICAAVSFVAGSFLLGAICVALCVFYLMHEPKETSDPLDSKISELHSSLRRKKRADDAVIREAMEKIDREFEFPDEDETFKED